MTTTSTFKENLYKSLGLASIATAIAFVGLDATIGEAVASAVSRILPVNLVNPVAIGGITFCTGIIYNNFLDEKVENFFRSIY